MKTSQIMQWWNSLPQDEQKKLLKREFPSASLPSLNSEMIRRIYGVSAGEPTIEELATSWWSALSGREKIEYITDVLYGRHPSSLTTSDIVKIYNEIV